MSAATLTLSRVRIAFRKPKPLSPRRIWLILWVIMSLLWVLKWALRFVDDPNVFDRTLDVGLAVLWGFLYLWHRKLFEQAKRREERVGLPLPPPSRREWGWLIFSACAVALPPW